MRFNPTKWSVFKSASAFEADQEYTYKTPLQGRAYGIPNMETISQTPASYYVIPWSADYNENQEVVLSENYYYTNKVLFTSPELTYLDLEFDQGNNPVIVYDQKVAGNGRVPGMYVWYKNPYTLKYEHKRLANSGFGICVAWYNKLDVRYKDLVIAFVSEANDLIYTTLSTNFNTLTNTNIKAKALDNLYGVVGDYPTNNEISYGKKDVSNSILVNVVRPNNVIDILYRGAASSTKIVDKYRGESNKGGDNVFNTSRLTASIGTTSGANGGALRLFGDYGLYVGFNVQEIYFGDTEWGMSTRFKMTALATSEVKLMVVSSPKCEFGFYISPGANPRVFFKFIDLINPANSFTEINGYVVDLNTWITHSAKRMVSSIALFVDRLPYSAVKFTKTFNFGEMQEMYVGSNFTGFVEYNWLVHDKMNPTELYLPLGSPEFYGADVLLIMDLRDSKNTEAEWIPNTSTYDYGRYDSSVYNRQFFSQYMDYTFRTERHCPYYEKRSVLNQFARPSNTTYYETVNFANTAKLRMQTPPTDFFGLNLWVASIWIDSAEYYGSNHLSPIFSLSIEDANQTTYPAPGVQGAFIAGETWSLEKFGDLRAKNKPIWIRGTDHPNPTVIMGNVPISNNRWSLVTYIYHNGYLIIFMDGVVCGGGKLPGGLLAVNGQFIFQSTYRYPDEMFGDTNYVSAGFTFTKSNTVIDQYNGAYGYYALDVNRWSYYDYSYPN